MAKISAAIVRDLRTLTDFIQAFEKFSSGTKSLKCYRGQRNASWANEAGIFRPELEELALNEKHAIRDLISVHPAEFTSDDSMFDKLVRMQHFGLPTRLLDVSVNALVALYFASENGLTGNDSDGVVTGFSIPSERVKYFDSDCVSCLANLANMTAKEKRDIYALRENRVKRLNKKDRIAAFNKEDVILRLHQFIKVEKPYFLPVIEPIDLFKPYYVHPKMSNRRIVAQTGAFIIYGIQPPKDIGFRHRIEETRFLVPLAEKEPIRSALANLGIGESTLFPEIDKAANRIKNQYTKRL